MKVLAPGAVTFATATRSHKCIGENTCICVRGEQRCAQARKVWAQRDRMSRSIPGAGVCCLVEQADDLDLGGNGAVSPNNKSVRALTLGLNSVMLSMSMNVDRSRGGPLLREKGHINGMVLCRRALRMRA